MVASVQLDPMSSRPTAWAWEHAPVTDQAQKMILLAMAEYARSDGTNVWLSQASIAERCCCSIRTVRTHLAALEESGLIRRGDPSGVPDRIPANRRPVVWDLQLSVVKSLADQADPDSEQMAESDTGKVTGNICRPANRAAIGVAQGGNSGAVRAANSAANTKTNQDLIGLPPRLDELHAAERSACDHGAAPGRCALCRGPESAASSAAQPRPPARSHSEEIRSALAARRRHSLPAASEGADHR